VTSNEPVRYSNYLFDYMPCSVMQCLACGAFFVTQKQVRSCPGCATTDIANMNWLGDVECPVKFARQGNLVIWTEEEL